MQIVKILDKLGNDFFIKSLPIEFCKRNQKSILSIINQIPYINWSENDLFEDNDLNENKWSHSLF